jgi:amidase
MVHSIDQPVNSSNLKETPAIGEPSEICRLSAVAITQLLRSKSLSSVEVVSAFFDRIESVNPVVNAIVNLRDREDVLREAQTADVMLSRGKIKGPLHGLPIAIKDLALTKGLITTFGSPIFQNFIPDTDDYHVARIKDSGAIVIGKTNVPEFGLGSNTYNQVFGSTKNAFDQSLIAGGSSGGAAVALATHMVPIADGSDMGGSLRNPAAYNNVYGFRPSQGRVPSGPQPEAFLSQMSVDGPLGRNVADLAVLLSVQAGYHPQSPLSLDGSLAYHRDWAGRSRQETHIAWLGDLGGYLPMEDGILELCEQALFRTREIGWKVEKILPDFDYERLWQAFVVLRQATGGAALAAHRSNPEHWSLLKPEAQWEVEGALRLTALDIFAASGVRTSWYQEVSSLTGKYDLLVLPTAQVFPFDVNVPWPAEIRGRQMSSYHRWMEVTAYATMAGCPAISVPVGFDDRGRPMGMQLIGAPRSDSEVLTAAQQYEMSTLLGGGR